MTLTDAIGYLAALLTTGSFLPQAVRVWRSRETHAISLPLTKNTSMAWRW